WTGTEMIVWGGNNYQRSGARYDPATNHWTPTSEGANLPARRVGHSVVWTGKEMIVWGGWDNAAPNGGFLNSGARYHPGSDTWMPASVIKAPTGRQHHIAIWT